jgi:Condensation domain
MKNVEDIYPLSPVQQGILFHAVYAPEAGMYMEQTTCTVHGNLCVSAFERAWQYVVDRHPILRTAFLWKGMDEPLQVVRQSVKLPWKQDDWRRLLPDEQQQKLEVFLRTDRAQGMELSRAPLLRLALFRLAEDAYQIVLTHHHLLTDGWSLALVFKEIFMCYEAFRQGQDIRLESIRPFRDYIAWLQQQDMSKAEALWRQGLKGFTTPTPLRTVREPGSLPAQEEVSGEQLLVLSEEETVALQALAQQHQLTMSTLVQGAWGLLLSHYSGKKDIVFGATTSGRSAALPGIESMIGLFINVLPVRMQVSPSVSLLSWLKDLQARQVELRQYEYSPLVQIHGWSEVPRDLPLFKSTLTFENYPVDQALKERKGSVEIHNFRVRHKGNYPLVVIAGLDSRLTLKTLYDCRHFDAATATRLLDHLAKLLNSMSAHPNTRLDELEDLLVKVERSERLMERRKRQESNFTNFLNVSPKAVSLSQTDNP